MAAQQDGRGLLSEAAGWWRGLSGAKRFFAIGLLAAPFCLLLWRDGRNLTLLLAGLPGLWFGFRIGFLRFAGTGARRWLWVVWLFLAVGIASWGLDGFVEAGSDRLGRHNRFLFFLPFLITLVWLRPPARLLWLTLGLAGIVIGLGAVAEIVAAGEGLSHRVSGGAHAMSFGIITSVIATLLLGAAWQQRSERALALVLLVGGLMTILGMLFTGVRAGPAGLGLGLFSLAILLAWFRDRAGVLLFAAGPVAVVVLTLAFPDTGMPGRFVRGVEQVSDYLRVEAMMPPREETAPGCQADPRLLRGWLASTDSADGNWQVIEVGDDAACGEGTRLRLSADSEPVTVSLPRAVPANEPTHDAVLHVRGQGARLRLRSGDWVTAQAESRCEAIAAGEARANRLDIRLQPGGWLEFTPEALFPGEYRYPHVDLSMDLRLEMWRISLAAFLERPFFGHGTGNFRSMVEPYIERGVAAPKLAEYQHAHSEYFDSLATRGLFGLATLLLLLAALVYVSLRPGPGHRRRAGHPGLPFAAAWVTLSGALLTEASFSMNLTVVTTAFFMALTLYLGNHWQDPEDWQRNRLAFWKR